MEVEKRLFEIYEKVKEKLIQKRSIHVGLLRNFLP